MTRLRPFLMFQKQNAEEAMNFYISLFPAAKVTDIQRYGAAGPGPEGTVMRADFTLAGQDVICIDSPVKHAFEFTPSFSFFIDCESEAELRRLHAALAAGRPVDVTVSGVAADSLGARRLGDIAFSMASQEPPVSVLVNDDAIIAARAQLWSEYRIPAEYGAATALAALTSGAYVPQKDERVAVIICGANTDPCTLGDPTP